MGRITPKSVRRLWGGNREPSTWTLSTNLFIRLLGLVYALAFGSLWLQVDGLIGADGILPAGEFLERVRTYAAQSGESAFGLAPTLCLYGSSDAWLHGFCAAGVGLSILLMAGVLPGLISLLLWLLYLSLTVVGQTFLGFQWENLLLETGLLAIFLAPTACWLGWRPVMPPQDPTGRWIWRGFIGIPRTAARLMLAWLLFRLMLQSGLVKLASNDDVWWNLTALRCHYWTQPLPTWVAYYASLLPLWFQKASVLIMYGIELILPFCMLGPRLFRKLACCGFVAFMALIALTGNYTYFNLLTAILCLSLVDDQSWPHRIRTYWNGRERPSRLETVPVRAVPLLAGLAVALNLVLAALMIEILPLSIFYLQNSLYRFDQVAQARRGWHVPVPQPKAGPALKRRLERWSGWRSVNSYGLFANMTESRPEIIIEGSDDGKTWRAYEFKYKPGDLARRPRCVAPHQPRLDWQMWFAALGDLRGNPWFISFMDRLLHGTPAVLDLLAKNPFPEHPPRLIRATEYSYTFTTPAEKSSTGNWWRRSNPQPYTPVLTLENDRIAVVGP